MKKTGLFISLVACWGLWSCNSWADQGNSHEPFFGTERAAAVFQNPSGAFNGVTGSVNTFAPAVEQLYDFKTGEWITATSIALWNFSSKQIPIASLRSGVAFDISPYAELQFDLPGITQRFISPLIPVNIKGALTAGILDGAWKLAGKYAHVGAFAGANLEEDDKGNKEGFMYGLALGGRLTF